MFSVDGCFFLIFSNTFQPTFVKSVDVENVGVEGQLYIVDMTCDTEIVRLGPAQWPSG